jgi:hypothetical protein
MNTLLKNIENSEDNNPLLTAALQEIGRLNDQINDIREVAEGTITSIRINGGPLKSISHAEENEIKVDLIRDILDDCRYGPQDLTE